jgi:C-terminal domain of 1-Cys peroxiredoxin
VFSVIDCAFDPWYQWVAVDSEPVFFSALQLTDKHKVATPVNWNQGDDIVVHVSLSTEEARKTYPNLVEHKVSVLQLRYRSVYADMYMFLSPTLGQHSCLYKE